jgi:hypothetical protein
MRPILALSWHLYRGIHRSGIVLPGPYLTGESSMVPPIIISALLSLTLGIGFYHCLKTSNSLYRWLMVFIAASIPLGVLAWVVKLNFMMVY